MTDAPIIAFVGKRGSGKTLGMTALMTMFFAGKDAIFYTNYDLSIPGIEVRKMSMEFLKSFFDKDGTAWEELNVDGRPIVLLIDELSMFLDAYDFRSKGAVMFSKFVLQTRKRGITFAYTTQQMRLVPIRIRDNTDYIVAPVFDEAYDELTLRIHDFDGRAGELVNRLLIDRISRFYGVYDTRQIIELVEQDEEDDEDG